MRTVNEALKIAQQVTGYELKEYQQQAIEAYLCGKDVFVSAPTVAGKSLITFELAPFALYARRIHFLDYRLVLVGTISTNDVCGQFRYPHCRPARISRSKQALFFRPPGPISLRL